MTTTFQHIAARDDRDLADRLIAAAEQVGIPEARTVVMAALPALIAQSIEVHGEETTITAVHAYADGVRRDYLADERALPPGLNPGAVTDDHLAAAIAAVLAPEEPEAT